MSTAASNIRRAVALPPLKAWPAPRSIRVMRTSPTPCTNVVRKTLYSTRSGSLQSRFGNPSLSLSEANRPYTANRNTNASLGFSQVVRRGFASSTSPAPKASTTTSTSQPVKKAGMMDKIKDLVKQYGYTGVAVYLGISMIDLAATFVIVKAAGMEKIEAAQDWVLDNVGTYLGYKTSAEKHAEELEKRRKEHGDAELDTVDDARVGAIYNKASGLWSVFVIAYGIHKLLVPLRVVATSMITPPLVKWLVKRGWIKEVVKKGTGATGAAAATSRAPKP
ncbi:hypothetical protein BGZ94_003612 [Podila epigama]|nr:hypothetical protein BGZ94_003612 [Podila epigama]